jgi:hypothetical protein
MPTWISLLLLLAVIALLWVCRPAPVVTERTFVPVVKRKRKLAREYPADEFASAFDVEGPLFKEVNRGRRRHS